MSAVPVTPPAGSRREPAIYRPFALLAYGTTVLVGSPLGVWMLSRLYLTGGQTAPAWLLLHAHLQLFGFFAVLVLGVAHHLVPRFTNRPVTPSRLTPWLLALAGAALVLRVAGTAAGWRAPFPVAALLQAAAFGLFGGWIWRTIAAPHLALTRRHLTLATAWLAAALVAEAALRSLAVEPDPHGMRAVHLMGTLGGVTGWILGVALRAAPMFVPGWSVPERVARAAPWTLALGVLVAVAGELGGHGTRGAAVVKLGEAIALGTVATVALTGGVARVARRSLPLLSRGAPEARLFRLALLSALAAALGSAAAAGLAWAGVPPSLLGDALRHLTTVGFLTSMALAMTFRLIPVLEAVPLSSPRLRGVAFWSLLGGIVLRTSEVLADWGWEAVLPWVPLSGLLVWLALACAAANLVGAMRPRPGPFR